MMGARSGTACHRAASALRGARLVSGSCAKSGASSPAGVAPSLPPKSAKASNLGLAGPAAASSRALSCDTVDAQAEPTASGNFAPLFDTSLQQSLGTCRRGHPWMSERLCTCESLPLVPLPEAMPAARAAKLQSQDISR